MPEDTKTKIEKTIQLKCFITSVRMWAMLSHTARAFGSTVTIARGGNVLEVKDVMDFMLDVEGPLRDNGIPSRSVKISVSGSDAPAAMKAILALFPVDMGPERCAFEGCNSPAVLVGGSNGKYRYRCRDSTKNHEWEVTPAAANQTGALQDH